MKRWKNVKVVALLAGAVALACLPFLLGGCAGGPPRLLYTPETNVTSEVVVPVSTNTVTVTNFVLRTVTITNQLPAAPDGTARVEVVPTVIRDGTVSNYTVVTFETNREFTVSYKVSTNAAAMANGAGDVVNVFAPGMGGLVSKGLLGLLSLGAGVGGLFARKYKQEGEEITAQHEDTKDKLEKTATSLAQSVQVYREIAQTTPLGEIADQQLKAWMQSHQQVLGVADIVANVLENNVNDAAARDLATQVITEANRLRGTLPRPASPVVAQPTVGI